MDIAIGTIALKSLVLILFAVAYYCVIIIPLKWLEKTLPQSKLKEFFFKRRFEERL